MLDPSFILSIFCRCGYATVHDVHDKSLEDRQESFFLSETVKYLYLLFDTDNPINTNDMKYIFSTEGHVLPLSGKRTSEYFAIIIIAFNIYRSNIIQELGFRRVI